MGAGIPQATPEQQLVFAPPFAGLQRRGQVTGLWGAVSREIFYTW